MKNPFRCRVCEAKDKEIKYLRSLVNSLLVGKKLPAIDIDSLEKKQEEPEKEEGPKGQVYGEG